LNSYTTRRVLFKVIRLYWR